MVGSGAGRGAGDPPVRRVVENKQGLLTQGTGRLPINLSRANTLAGGSLRTSTRPELGARLAFRVNAHTYARRRSRRRRINVGRVLVLNKPPARCPPRGTPVRPTDLQGLTLVHFRLDVSTFCGTRWVVEGLKALLPPHCNKYSTHPTHH